MELARDKISEALWQIGQVFKSRIESFIPIDASPLVRGAAVWALSQLIARDALAALASRAGDEPDITVQQEWGAAAAP